MAFSAQRLLVVGSEISYVGSGVRFMVVGGNSTMGVAEKSFGRTPVNDPIYFI